MRSKFGKRASLIFVHRDKREVVEEIVRGEMSISDRATRILNLDMECQNEALCDYTVLANTSIARMAEKVIAFVES